MLQNCVLVGGVNIRFEGELQDGFLQGFQHTFSRRYLPEPILNEGCLSGYNSVVERYRGVEFKVLESRYDVDGVLDYFKVVSDIPQPYLNESPVFFLLQVAARGGAKIGRFFLTDSVAVVDSNGEAILFLGYPHTGKSTIALMAYSKGLEVLSTENTVVELREGKLHVVGGTKVLVYDPWVAEVYNIKETFSEETKHGYRVVDLAKATSKAVDAEVRSIAVLHSAVGCGNASLVPVKGRKITKILWYFTTALIKGVDFYEPNPLDMPFSTDIEANLRTFLSYIVKNYEGKIFEVFGNHNSIFNEFFFKK